MIPTAHARPNSIEPEFQNAWAIDRANRSGRQLKKGQSVMDSQPETGKPGHSSSAILVIAVIVFAAYVDKRWLTIFLGVIVLYGLVVDLLNRL